MMPLPQPIRSQDDALHGEVELPEHVPHINTELITITTEGFKLILNVIVELTDYIKTSRTEYADYFPVEDSLEKLKEFVNS